MATAFATPSICNVVSLVYANNQAVFALLLTFRRRVTFRSKRPSSCSQVPRFSLTQFKKKKQVLVVGTETTVEAASRSSVPDSKQNFQHSITDPLANTLSC